jgi:hypothetical protein
MEAGKLDILFVQEPGAGLVSAAQTPSQSTRSTRQSQAHEKSPVSATVVENPHDRGGNIVVLSQQHLNVHVTPLRVEDRRLAVAEVNSGGNRFVVASMHAPEHSGSRGGGGSSGPQFMINAARTAAAEGVDTLIGDTNIYGESAPRAAERATRSATRGEDPQAFNKCR